MTYQLRESQGDCLSEDRRNVRRCCMGNDNMMLHAGYSGIPGRRRPTEIAHTEQDLVATTSNEGKITGK